MCTLRCFNTQPPEGGCKANIAKWIGIDVSTHSRPKAADFDTETERQDTLVSTHSRPKAAGYSPVEQIIMTVFQHTAARRRLISWQTSRQSTRCFNTQPPEGGWIRTIAKDIGEKVSTHSRPKAAVMDVSGLKRKEQVSTHSRPKAAGLNWIHRYLS